jgi:putative PIN family toxin of toxin-antitoxin system
MIRATLDVNVLASGFQDTPGVPAVLIDSWVRGAYELLISDHILDGLTRTLQKPYFQRHMTPDQIERVFAILRTRALIVIPSVAVHGIGEDEEDDLVLSTALTGSAGYLVTGDQHLQQIGSYQDLIILPPRGFLDVLARDVS